MQCNDVFGLEQNAPVKNCADSEHARVMLVLTSFCYFMGDSWWKGEKKEGSL